MTPPDGSTASISGAVNLYKPPGLSSAYYVYRLRPIFNQKKVGHAGTLDPFADGVLLACLGNATKLVESLMGLPKLYRTTLRLGVTNETFDTERPFEVVAGATPPGEAAVRECLARFVGEIEQVPPVFSAMRVGGTPSYKRARKGKAVELAARPVRIDRVELIAYEYPRLVFDVLCGRGTYIRSIARDIGAALKCGACCEFLTRLAVGPFRMEESVRLDAGDETVRRTLMPVDAVREILAGAPKG